MNFSSRASHYSDMAAMAMTFGEYTELIRTLRKT